MGFWERFLGKEKRKVKGETIDKVKSSPTEQAEAVVETVSVPVQDVAPASTEIDPQIIAAIIAGIEAATDDAELMAAVMAAAVHAHNNSAKALRIKRSDNAWVLAGRQKLMYNRQQ